MSKKAIIISIIAVVVVAGGAVAALWWFNNQAKAPIVSNDPNQTETVVPDFSEDYGACDLFTKDIIKSSLGSVADNLADGVNSGRIFGQDGAKAQNCTYAFDSSDMANSNFNVEIYIYKTQADVDGVVQAHKDDKTFSPVSALGENAVSYESDLTDLGRHQFSVLFYKGLNQYTLTITQPSGSSNFTADTAIRSLTTLAGEIKL